MDKAEYQCFFWDKKAEILSRLHTHWREQGSLEAGDFLSHVVKSNTLKVL